MCHEHLVKMLFGNAMSDKLMCANSVFYVVNIYIYLHHLLFLSRSVLYFRPTSGIVFLLPMLHF